MRRGKVRRVGVEVLPRGVIEDGIIIDRAVLGATIQRLIKKLKIIVIGGRAGISLSGSAVIIKQVNLAKPHTDPDFYEYLYHEIEQYLQYDVSELYVDWEVLPNIQGRNDTSVLLVGAKRTVVEEYAALISSVGLKASLVDCDVLASINIVSHTTDVKQDLVVIANVGCSSTQITLLINGIFTFSRDVPIGGDNYSSKMVELMGLDFDSAETLKITTSNGEQAISEECENIVNEINSSLAHEINATIEYYFQNSDATAQAVKLSKICLMGGGSKIKHLDATIREILQTQVEHINPFQKVEVNNNMVNPQFISQHGYLFGPAMGIALHKMNDKK